MRIGMIGVGKIGMALGSILAAAGHDVVYGARNAPGESGITSVADAARFGELVVFAAPFWAWPDFAFQYAGVLGGKIVINAANPITSRDLEVANAVILSGETSGRYVAGLVPDSTLVQCFKTLFWTDLRDQSRRQGERLAMPLAGDSPEGNEFVAELVFDVGFSPVVIGNLDNSREIDPGGVLFGKLLTAAETRLLLSHGSSPRV